MNDLVFTTLIVTGFTVAFLHAAIPTHWLPFVVAARAQRWNNGKTLAITGVAGAGHVIFTTGLGVLVAWGGIAINAKMSRTFPLIAGGALILVGLFYLSRQIRGSHGHVHLFRGHSHHEHEHTQAHDHYRHAHDDSDLNDDDHRLLHEEHVDHEHAHTGRQRSDLAVIGGLFALLTFSPCEAFLPVFLTGAKYGWLGFFLLSSVLALATVAGMVVFTWLTLLGLQRLRLRWIAKYEALAVGLVFCGLGLMIILFEA
jgi:nickel/cobalt exporter